MTAVEEQTVEWATSDPALEQWLDEHGRHYEVIDGKIVVSPAPEFAHQDVLSQIFKALINAAPPGWKVIWLYGYGYDDNGNWVEPDIAVLPPGTYKGSVHRVTPALVVEALSPSTKRWDLEGKRRIYAEGGVPSYWIVEPQEPSMTVLELRDGGYDETARIAGDEALTVAAPYAVTVRLTPA